MLGPVTTSSPDAAASRHPHGAPTWAVVTSLVLVAANLRTLMASLPPLAQAIRADLEMPPGVNVSGLESDGGDRFFCGGGGSGKVRAVRRPRRKVAAASARTAKSG